MLHNLINVKALFIDLLITHILLILVQVSFKDNLIKVTNIVSFNTIMVIISIIILIIIISFSNTSNY